MLSYSWGYGVGTIADTLTDFFGRDVHRYVWICCLCINQHRVKEAQAAGEVVPFKEFEEAFGKRVAGVSHILAMMSPWQEPLYLKRVWCVFEFSRAMAEKKETTPRHLTVAALNQRVKEKLQAWFVDTAATWLEKKIASDHRIEAAPWRIQLDLRLGAEQRSSGGCHPVDVIPVIPSLPWTMPCST
eukprot:g14152.t1